jgi:hypothetical protein
VRKSLRKSATWRYRGDGKLLELAKVHQAKVPTIKRHGNICQRIPDPISTDGRWCHKKTKRTLYFTLLASTMSARCWYWCSSFCLCLCSWLGFESQLYVCENLCWFTWIGFVTKLEMDVFSEHNNADSNPIGHVSASSFVCLCCPFSWGLPIWVSLLCFFIASSWIVFHIFKSSFFPFDSFRYVSFPFFAFLCFALPCLAFTKVNRIFQCYVRCQARFLDLKMGKGRLASLIQDGLTINCALSPVEGHERPWDLWRSCYLASHRCTCIFDGDPVSLPGAAAPLSEPSHDLAGDPQGHETDQAILSASTIQRFGWLGDIARLTCRSCSAVHSHLTSSLGFRIRHLRWIRSVSTYERMLNQVPQI